MLEKGRVWGLLMLGLCLACFFRFKKCSGLIEVDAVEDVKQMKAGRKRGCDDEDSGTEESIDI